MLPSFSFGAEGVEYGRSSSYYATTAGNEVFPDDVNVQGNLTVEGNTTLRGTGVNGSLTVSQGLTGGTRTAYFTNGGSPPAEKSVAIFNDQSSGTLTAWRNNGNEGTLQFDGGVTGGQFVLNRPLTLPSGGGSSGNLTVGGSAVIGGNATVNAGVLAAGGYYGTTALVPASFPVGIVGASLTTPPSFPVGFTSAVPPTSSYQLLTATPGQSSSFNVTASSGSIYLGNVDTTPDLFQAGVNTGWTNKYGLLLNNPSWNSKTIILAMVRPQPFRLVSLVDATFDYGVMNCSVNPDISDPTTRGVQINGVGQIPNTSLVKDFYVDFVIFQGV